MSETIQVTGCVLSAAPIGETDKRVVLLTRELGRISAFARGARRPGSPLMAVCSPFVFCTFTLVRGRTSNSLSQARVLQYFTELTAEQPGVYFGFYFLDFAGWYSREGIDATDTLNLLYLSVKALLNPHLDDRLVRRLFEIRLLTINGEFAPEAVTEAPGRYGALSGTAASVLRYAASGPLEKLFTFALDETVLSELEKAMDRYLQGCMEHPLKSLSVLEGMLQEGSGQQGVKNC